jgi:hypothetical protein
MSGPYAPNSASNRSLRSSLIVLFVSGGARIV